MQHYQAASSSSSSALRDRTRVHRFSSAPRPHPYNGPQDGTRLSMLAPALSTGDVGTPRPPSRRRGRRRQPREEVWTEEARLRDIIAFSIPPSVARLYLNTALDPSTGQARTPSPRCRPVRLALFGHSHVRRMGDAVRNRRVREEDQLRSRPWRPLRDRHDFQLWGIGGARAAPRTAGPRVEDDLGVQSLCQAYCPDILVLFLGDNDIRPGINTRRLATSLVLRAYALSPIAAVRVLIPPMPRRYDVLYNQAAGEVTRYLEEIVAAERDLVVWCYHRRNPRFSLERPDVTMFCDAVHLHHWAYLWLAREIEAAMQSCLPRITGDVQRAVDRERSDYRIAPLRCLSFRRGVAHARLRFCPVAPLAP